MTAAGPSTLGARADAAWAALESSSISGCCGRLRAHEPGRARRVPLWPFSQVLHAAAGAGSPSAGGLRRALEAYRCGPAYAVGPRAAQRYYDDNAWVALALLAHGDTAAAARILGYLRGGCVRLPGGGIGVRWLEGGEPSLHACSTGATGLVALGLAETGAEDADRLRELAEGCSRFLATLQRDDGLVADNRRPDGSVEPTAWTYNQGLLIALRTGLGRVDEALDLALAVRSAFDEERLWAHPAAFNAVLIRCLVRLDSLRPSADLGAWCQAYLDRVWEQARDARTGLFSEGGIGLYGGGRVLDHAALTCAMHELARGGPR